MFAKFWEGLTEGLGDRWAAQELGPALAFWLGGLLAWVWHRYYLNSWRKIVDWVTGIDNTAACIALAVGGLLVLAVSSVMVKWLQLPMLRLMEGYWPWPLRGPRFWLARLWEKHAQRKDDEWQKLAKIEPEKRTAEQQAEYARLDAKLARYPVDTRRLMPTPLGNLLRAAEEYPYVRYRLAMSVCWPRLWLVLPEGTQSTLVETRQKLNGATRLFLWGLAFFVWTVWAWWAVLVALAVIIAAYWAMLQTAGVYGDLLCAAFDLHRFALYKELHWPLPLTPADEEKHGQQLSEYLFRGTGGNHIQFAHPGKK